MNTQQTVTNDKGGVTFPCPACGKAITRSRNARLIGAKYTCSCGFMGPN